MSEQLTVNYDDLIPDPDNLRRRVSVPELRELATSIATRGVLQPLRVYADGNGAAGKFHIIAGHRRWAAVGMLRDEQSIEVGLPIVVVPFDSMDGVKADQLVENIQRSDLDPVEEGEGYRYLQDAGRKVKDIVALVGKSQSHVSKRLALLKLPKSVHAAMRADLIGLEEAYQLSKFAQYAVEIDAVIEQCVSEKRHVTEYEIERLGDRLEKAEQRQRILSILEDRGIEVVDADTIDTKTLERTETFGFDELPEAAFADDDIVTVEMPAYGYPKITRWGTRVKGSTEPTDSQKRERERKRTEREARLARLETAQSLARRPAKSGVAELAFLNLAHSVYDSEAKAVCEILVLDPVMKEGTRQDKEGNEVATEAADWGATLRQALEKEDIPAHRIALASLLATWVAQGPATKDSRRYRPAYTAVSDFVDNQTA